MRIKQILAAAMLLSFACHCCKAETNVYTPKNAAVKNGLLYDKATAAPATGTAETRYPSGRLKSSAEYKDGRRMSLCTYPDDDSDRPIYTNIYTQDGRLLSKSAFDENGVPQTEYFKYYPSGKLMESSTKSGGKINGPARFYDESGRIRGECMFRDNVKHGMYREYYADGTTERELLYKNDKQVRGRFYYPDGTLRREHRARGDECCYHYRKWDETGALTEQWEMEENGEGVMTNYYPSGRVRMRTPYHDFGIARGVRRAYLESGALKEEAMLENSRMHGMFRVFRAESTEVEVEVMMREGRPVEGYFYAPDGTRHALTKDDFKAMGLLDLEPEPSSATTG